MTAKSETATWVQIVDWQGDAREKELKSELGKNKR